MDRTDRELDQMKLDAQRTANRDRAPAVILNLNPAGRRLLVIRGADVLKAGETPYAGPFHPQTGYRAEFPDFPPETLPAIPDGWRDGSWHNDTCPFFEISPSLGVFVDYADPALSEYPQGRASGDMKRFTLVALVDGAHVSDDSGPLCCSDDWGEILAHAIARAFAANLAEELTADQMAQVVERNKTVDPGVCASHDFCDANMVMDPAFTQVMRREIDLNSEADCALWGQAWDIALAAGFWFALPK
jgi:hypothetical protein